MDIRAFICVGLAIILGILLVGVHAHYCTECCDGNPCNPELYAKMLNQTESNGMSLYE